MQEKPSMSLSTPSRKQIVGFVVFTLVLQRAGFMVLGTGRSGTLFVSVLQIAICILAVGCALVASKRGRGVARLFWLLFATGFAFQFVADVGWAYCHYFNIAVPDAALFPSLFYRLFAAPTAIILFLSDDFRTSKLETFLDGCVVVGLVGLGMYQIQMAELSPHDPNMGQLITTTVVVNCILAVVAFFRYAFSASGRLRSLFGRLAIYLAIYCCISFATSYVDTYLPNYDNSFDLIWIVTYLSAAVLAITWRPNSVEDQRIAPRMSRRAALLWSNVSMAVIVVATAILGLGVAGSSRIVGLAAIGLVMVSYAVRCALMQDAQETYVAALQESNTRYQCVSLATNDVLWDRSVADNTITWNDNVYSLFGYAPGEVAADRDWWINTIHPDDRDPILLSVGAVLESASSARSGEYRLRKANGSYAYVFDRCYVVRDALGKPVRVIGSIQDLTERKEAELEIHRARDAAEAAAKAKSEFVSNMSHEIRTPLNGILGTLELACETELSPEQKELLTMAGESARTLLSVVNDVLDFSKIEAGKMELEQREIDVPETVAEATRTVLVLAQQKKLDLLYQVAADVPRRVIGDSARLKQVLINLLANAVKFTEHGSIIVRVGPEASRSGEIDLRFSVSDTGIGIPPEKQKAIFESFSQADNSVTRRFGGTGLGLTICSKIVGLMNGRIWVESEAGKGSTFSFTARFAPDVSANAVTSPPSPTLSQAMPPQPQQNSVAAKPSADGNALVIRSLSILLAEDNIVNQRLAQKMLQKLGHLVEIVGNGREALDKVKSGAVDLVFMDCHMPEMDGLAASRAIRQWEGPRGTHIPIIAMTAMAMEGDQEACLKAGMDAFIPKPVAMQALRETIQLVMGASAQPSHGNDSVASSTDEGHSKSASAR